MGNGIGNGYEAPVAGEHADDYLDRLGLLDQVIDGLLATPEQPDIEAVRDFLDRCVMERMRSASLLGQCAPDYVRSRRRGNAAGYRIRINRALTDGADTVLHEIAHGWVMDHHPHADAHGHEWKRTARAIGCEATRTGRDKGFAQERAARTKVVLRCRRCSHEVRRLKRFPRHNEYAHRGCGGLYDHV